MFHQVLYSLIQAGAAIGIPLSDVEKHIYFVNDFSEQELSSPMLCAYARARGKCWLS